MIASFCPAGRFRALILAGLTVTVPLAWPAPATAQPRDRYPPMAEPPQSPRLARLTCERLASMSEGITEAGWARVAGFPLAEITSAEARDLERFVSRCQRTVGDEHRRALRQISGQMFYVVGAARQREGQAAGAEAARRKQAALDALVASAVQEIEEATRQQALRDPGEQCRPEPHEIAYRIGTRIDIDVFRRHVENTPQWQRLQRDCTERFQRSQQAIADAARKPPEGPNPFHQAALDYAAEMQARHAERLSTLRLPNELLDAPLNLPLDNYSSVGLFFFDARPITLRQWLAMLIEAAPATEIGAGREWRGSWFSIKFPNERTITLVVEQDGADWFITRFRQGNTDEQVGPGDLQSIGALFALRSQLVWRANARMGQGRK